MGYSTVNSSPLAFRVPGYDWLTAVLLLLHIVSRPLTRLQGCKGTYRHRLAQRHGLPHEELRALAHGHHARGLHGHHACWLHGEGAGGFEHDCGIGDFAIGVGSGELASSLGIESASRVSSQAR